MTITCRRPDRDWRAPGGGCRRAVSRGGSRVAGGLEHALPGCHPTRRPQGEASRPRLPAPYRLLKRLGAGGMGEVYLAENTLLRRPCAVKLLRPEQAGDPMSLVRLEREVRALASLTHRNT